MRILILSEPVYLFLRKMKVKVYERFWNPNNFFEEVHIASLKDFGTYVKEDVTFNTLRIHPIRIEKLMPNLPKLIIIISKIVNLYDIDIIRANSPFLLGLVAVIVGKITKIPSVVGVHDEYSTLANISNEFLLNNKFIQDKWEKFVLQNANAIYIPSKHLLGYLSKRGIKHRLVVHAPNKAYIENFQNLNWTTMEKMKKSLGLNNSLKIISVARLHPKKNLDTLLRAFSIIRPALRDNVELIHVGKDLYGQQAKLENLAKTLGIRNKVRFVGFFSQNDLAALYHLSDIFIHLSLVEGFGYTIVEALASGLPSIVTKSSWAVERGIIDGLNGFLVDPLDPFEAARALEVLIENKELRDQFGKNAKLQIIRNPNKYTWENIAQQEVAYYRRIMKIYAP